MRHLVLVLCFLLFVQVSANSIKWYISKDYLGIVSEGTCMDEKTGKVFFIGWNTYDSWTEELVILSSDESGKHNRFFDLHKYENVKAFNLMDLRREVSDVGKYLAVSSDCLYAILKGVGIIAFSFDGKIKWSKAINASSKWVIGPSNELIILHSKEVKKEEVVKNDSEESSESAEEEKEIETVETITFISAISPTGKLLWERSVEKSIGEIVKMVLVDKTLYIFTKNGTYLVYQNGYLEKRNFDFGFDENYELLELCIDFDGTVYGVFRNSKGQSYIFSSTLEGTSIWIKEIQNLKSSKNIFLNTSSNGFIYLVFGSFIYTFRYDGRQLWTFKTFEDISCSPAVSAEGRLYVIAKRDLYCISDGNVVWKARIDHPCKLQPILSKSGSIFVISERGDLYVFRDSTKGVDKSAWSSLYGNNQNTLKIQINRLSKPVLFGILDSSQNVSINPTLQWSIFDISKLKIVYDVYLGQSKNLNLIQRNLDKNEIALKNLKPGTTYYFKIVAKRGDGLISESPVFAFKTSNTGIGLKKKLNISHEMCNVTPYGIYLLSDDKLVRYEIDGSVKVFLNDKRVKDYSVSETGQVFVLDNNGTVFCYDYSGRLNWKFALPKPKDIKEKVSFSEGNLLLKGNYLLVGAYFAEEKYDDESYETKYHYAYCLSTSGKYYWHAKIADQYIGDRTYIQDFYVLKDTFYISVFNEHGRYEDVYTIAVTKNGKILGEKQYIANITGLFLGETRDGKFWFRVHSYDRNFFYLEELVLLSGNNIVAKVSINETDVAIDGNGNAYFFKGNILKSLDTNGKERWRQYLTDFGTAGPVFDNNTKRISLATEDGKIWTFDLSGKLVWSKNFQEGKAKSIFTDKNGNIYVVFEKDVLIKLSQNGTIMWRLEFPEVILSVIPSFNNPAFVICATGIYLIG